MSDFGILHLSDLQFGAHHRFQREPVDLADSILDDLRDRLHLGEVINFIIITGDIAEWAMETEFAHARLFLLHLLEELHVDLDHLLIVPGNHDVNWKLCEAYFLECEARNIEPQQPFEAKYRFFNEFMQGLYGRIVDPWPQIRDFPDHGVAFALLNSTVMESHNDHYGVCGADQYRAAARRLAQLPDRVRILAMHHNVRRKAQVDDENLRDEGLLTTQCGQYIDLVLHGHTHDGQKDYLPDGTLVLSTGSAAVSHEFRPDDIGNQYQVLLFSGSSVKRVCRAYSKANWHPDGSVGRNPPGEETVEIARLHVKSSDPVSALSVHKHSRPRDSDSVQTESSSILTQVYESCEVDPDRVRHYRSILRDEILAINPDSLTQQEFLMRLGLMTQGGHLTGTGVLMVGLNPGAYFASAALRCSKYEGINRSASKVTRLFEGTMPAQISSGLEFIRAGVATQEDASNSSDGRAIVQTNYAMGAVREILANGIVHRDYADDQRSCSVALFQDRIEVWSPGSWVIGQLSGQDTPLSELFAGSVRRNPSLARALGFARLFEGEGSGLQVAVSESRKGGAREPHARQENGYCIVTLYPFAYDIDSLGRARAVAVGTAKRQLSRERVIQDFDLRDRDRQIVSVANLLTAASPIVVIGGPGQGKTTLAWSLMSTADDRGLFPLYIDLQRSSQDLQFEGSSYPRQSLVRQLILKELESLGVRTDAAQLDAIVASHGIAFLFDGLDVFPERWQGEFLLDVGSRGWKSVPVVVLSRSSPAIYAACSSLNIGVLELESWDLAKSIKYTQDNLGSMSPARVAQFLDAFEGDNGEHVPLILSLLRSSRYRKDVEAIPLFEIVRSTISAILSRDAERSATWLLSERESVALLAEVATLSLTKSDVPGIIPIAVLRDLFHRGEWTYTGLLTHDDMVDQLMATPFLRWISVDTVAFTHRVIFEYFAARSFFEQSETWPLAEIALERREYRVLDFALDYLEDSSPHALESTIEDWLAEAPPAKVPRLASVLINWREQRRNLRVARQTVLHNAASVAADKVNHALPDALFEGKSL